MGRKVTFKAPYPTYLTSNGYAIDKQGNEELVEGLKTMLTVKPKTNPNMPSANDDISFPVYRESDKRLYIPKYLGLQTFGVPTKDILSNGKDLVDIKFKGQLREEQVAPVNEFLKAAHDPLRRGGLLVLPCAFGKTCLSLYIACQLKKKTLIVCHKEFLLKQWKERIDMFVDHVRIGTIKGKVLDVENKDVVLASLQSLAMKEYDPAIFKEFGFLILDECHHLGAEVFSNALSKVVCRYTLGLSATPDRKDGLRKVFEWYIGKPAFEVRKRQENELDVIVKEYYDPHPDYGKELLMWNGKPNMVQMLNKICSYAPRNEMIVDTICDIKCREPDRKFLILSARLNHLRTLRSMVSKRNIGTTGMYIGGMKEEEMKESETKDFIFASYNIAAEGFDVPCLNTLILASPVSAIEQPVGRIQRQKPHERKYVPLVVDVVDNFSMFRNQGNRRIAFYKKNGYTIQGIPAESNDDEDTSCEKQKVDFIPDTDSDTESE